MKGQKTNQPPKEPTVVDNVKTIPFAQRVKTKAWRSELDLPICK